MEITNNTKNQQFEVRLEDHLAVLQYRMKDNTMYFLQTKVPEPLGGKGIASTMAKEALTYAKENSFKIVVFCPFVVEYIKRHRVYLELLDTTNQQLDRFN
jgi:predicted GNAT family acetyltransferase